MYGPQDKGCYVLIVGDPVVGYDYIGPFDGYEEAVKYGEDQGYDQTWWATQLLTP